MAQPTQPLPSMDTGTVQDLQLQAVDVHSIAELNALPLDTISIAILAKDDVLQSVVKFASLQVLVYTTVEDHGLSRRGMLAISMLTELRELYLIEELDGLFHLQLTMDEVVSCFSAMPELTQLEFRYHPDTDGDEIRTLSAANLFDLGVQHPKLTRLELPVVESFLALKDCPGPLFPELWSLSIEIDMQVYYPVRHHPFDLNKYTLPTEDEALAYVEVILQHCPKLHTLGFNPMYDGGENEEPNHIHLLFVRCVRGRDFVRAHPDLSYGNSVHDYLAADDYRRSIPANCREYQVAAMLEREFGVPVPPDVAQPLFTPLPINYPQDYLQTFQFDPAGAQEDADAEEDTEH